MTHILLIDDHPLFCGGFIATCESLRPGFKVSLAGCAKDAEAFLDSQRYRDTHGPVSCVLIDINLTDANGFDTLEDMARRDPLTPRVMISGRDDRAAQLKAKRLGASGFISKGLNPEAIVKALDVILAGGVHFDGLETAIAPRDDETEGLTARQLEVLDLLAEGCANKEIEDRLGLADRTVRAHLTEIFKTLGVQGRIRAVMEARRRGMIA